MELKEIALPPGKRDKDVVAVVKKIYPRYDKMLHSKCKRGREYGIQLREDAVKAVCVSFGIPYEVSKEPKEPDKPEKEDAPQEARKQRKAENRTLPCRVYCRLSEIDYNELQQAISSRGFKTTQDFLSMLIKRYLLQSSVSAKQSHN